MKTRKILAFLVSTSMTFNVLISSSADIVSADELDDVTLQEVPENLEEPDSATEETESIIEETEAAEEAESVSDETEFTEEVTEEIPEEIAEAIEAAPFNEEAEVDGVIISVSADEGVFPEGAYMNVERVEDTEDSDALIEETLDDDVNIAHSMTFDITIYDSEGNEIEPDTEAGNVYVSFTDSLVADSNLDVDVYHITDEDEAIALDVNVEDELVVAETDGFSYYVVVFTYNAHTYDLEGESSVALSTILAAVGISGEVTDVTISDPSVLTYNVETGMITSTNYSSAATAVTVTVDDVPYEITVTASIRQADSNGQIGYRVTSRTYANGNHNVYGIDVYGLDGSTKIPTTYSDLGYSTAIRVGDGSTLYFDDENNFELGRIYTSDGVETYVTAEIHDQAVYFTYTVTNTNSTNREVRLGTYGDCKIGTSANSDADHAIIQPNGNGLSMSYNGQSFYLLPGNEPFTNMWVGVSNGAQVRTTIKTHVFDDGIAENDGSKDSALAWSWEMTVPAGETVTRVAILAVASDDVQSTITFNSNGGSGSMDPMVYVNNLNIALPANAFTNGDQEFRGWTTDPDSKVIEYTDGQSIRRSGDVTLYAVWLPQAEFTSLPSINSGLIYNGNDQVLVQPGDSSQGNVQYSLDGTTWTDNYEELVATGAGTYTVFYKIAGDADHMDSAIESVDVTIAPATLTLTVDDATKVMGQLDPTYTATITGEINPGDAASIEYDISRSDTGEAAGTYVLSATVTESTVPANYTVVIQTGTLTIIAVSPTVVDDLTYNGQPQELVTSPDPADFPDGCDEIWYSVDGGTWSQTATSADAGEHEIAFEFRNSNTGTSVNGGTMSVSIERAAITLTADNADKTFGEDDPANFTARITAGTLYGTDTLDYSVSRESGENVGDYDINITLGTNNNYNVTVVSGTFNISVATAPEASDLNANQKPTVNTLVYNGDDQHLVTSPVTTDYPAGYDTLLYKDENGDWVTDIPTGNDAGNYTVEFKYVDSSGNRAPIEGTIENINIGQASGLGTVTDEQRPHAVDGTVTYDGTAQTLVTDEGMTSYPAGYNDVMYKVGSEGDWSYDLPSEINAGNYTIYVKYMPADSNHVEFIDSATIPVRIEKAPVTITVNADQGMRYGENETALVARVEGKPASGADVIYSISRAAGTDVGTYAITVTATEADNPNYEITVNNNATFTISQATAPSADSLDPDQKPTAVNAAYNPNGVALANGPTEALPYYTVEYSLNGTDWSEGIPTADHVGVYDVYYRYNGDANHADAEGGSFTSTVTAATPSDSQKPTANNTTFVDQDVPLVNNPTTPIQGATVEYSTDGTYWSTTPPTGGAGTYDVQYRYNDGSGYANYAGGTINVTITQASAGTISDSQKPTAVNTTFDPNGVALANAPATALSGYTVEYSLNGTDWSEGIPTADHVGVYDVYYRYNGDANHADAEGGSFTSRVTAATPTNSQKPTANNTTFVDQDVPLVNNPTTPVQGATVQYSTNGTDWSTTPPTGGAGRYEVQYRYVDADGNENYAGGTISVEVSQAPAPSLTDAQKPTVNSLHYTGNDQELVTSPAATDYPQGYDTLLYKNGNGDWVSAIPTGNAATNYTVEFRYEDSTGNRAPIEGTVPVRIAPAEAPNASDVNDNEKPTPISGLTYTGSAQNLVTAPSTLPEGYDQVWYRTDDGNEWSQTIPTGTDAGDYEVSVKYVDSFGNHEDLTGVTVTGKINPAASALALLTEDNKPHAASGLYWTGDPQVLVVNPSDMPTNYEFIEYNVDGGDIWVTEPTGTDIKTYTVAYRYIDSDGNYQPITGGSLTATIYAAQAPNPSILTDEQKPHAVADLTYDGQSHELVSAPTGTLPNNYEKVMYSTDGGTTWSDAIPAKTFADDYTVNYKYVDTDGAYADLIVPDSIPVSIAPAPAPDVDTLPDDQKPAAIDGLEYTGSAQDLIDSDTPATLPDGYDQIWYSTDGGSTWSQNIPTGTDAGEYEILYKYVDADGDHEDITGGSVTVSIAPADAPSADSLTDANKPSAVDDLAYTGSAQNLVTPPSTLPDGYDQVWYSTDGGNTWSQTIPTGTDAGDYEVSVKYVDSNGNHDDLTGVTVPVTIAPAEAPDASSLTAAQKPTAVNGLAYTGSEQELVNAPSSLPAGYDEVWYSTDGGNTWSQDIPTGIEAGNYTVSVKYVDTDGNYEDLTGITVPVTIAQEAAPELTDAQKPSAVSGLTYTGSAQALVSAPASLPDGYEQVWYSLDGGNTWTQTIPTGTNAGTYTISVRYVDTDGIKADILGPDITVTIAAGTTTAVINGVAQTVTIGSTLARPEDPTRYGYDFTGWFADEACTIPYNFNTPVGVNGVTLYAGWAQVSYSLTEGGESTWNGNSDSTLTFRAVRNRLEPMTFSHFTGIRVDGKDVSKDNYQAKSGSVIVTLNESYLKTLSAGEHTLDIMFDDAPSVRTTFTIVAAQVPSTGESAYSAYSILGALLIASAAAFVIYSARHEEA